MSDYYPEFYLRRRQREQAQRRAAVVTVGVIVMFVAGALVVWLVSSFWPGSGGSGASPELAEQQRELQTQRMLANANVPGSSATEADAEPVELKDVPYSESMPRVNIGLQGLGMANAAEVTTEPGQPFSDPDLDSIISAAAPPPTESDSQAAAADSRVDRVTPRDDSADTAKKEEAQADRQAVNKRSDNTVEKKTEQKAEQPKPAPKKEEPKTTEKPAENRAEAKREEPKPAADPPAEKREPSYTYTVYASTYLSREEAEKAKANLGALGLSGSVIDAKTGDYLLRVHTLEDMKQADALRSKLQSSGFGGAFVTRKSD